MFFIGRDALRSPAGVHRTPLRLWRFESVHGFASVGNLYQKMHFAGSNLSTDPKCCAEQWLGAECIYKISKNLRVEKSGEISRNLRFFCSCHPLDSLFCGKATAGKSPFRAFSGPAFRVLPFISQNKRPPRGWSFVL